jgi:BspA type Leucine rich repeat region (6 copies)
MKTKHALIQLCLVGALLLPIAVQAQFVYTTSNGQVTITGDTAQNGTEFGHQVIPDTINGLPVVSIGTRAFQYNMWNYPGFSSLIIGKNVTNIGQEAFEDQPLTNILLPQNLISIGDSAFGDNPSLKAVYFQGNPPTILGQDIFGGCDNATIYYPVGTSGWPALFTWDGPVAYGQFFMVINGGFDDTADFFGWTVTGSGSAQVTGPNAYSGPYAAVFSETAGTLVNGMIVFGTTNMLSQTLPTQAGASYVLSFAANSMNGATGHIGILWDGKFIGTQSFDQETININPGWAKYQFVVTATSTNTMLQFYIPDVFEDAQTIGIDSVSVLPQPQISARLVNNGSQMNFVAFTGTINANYVLDRTSSLTPPINWVPRMTNSSSPIGLVAFADTPSTVTNNFWRVRSVP